MESTLHEKAVEHWQELRRQAFETVFETGEAMPGPDGEGLLILAGWIAGQTVEALLDEEVGIVAAVFDLSGPFEWQLEKIAELLYDDLFESLRGGGFLL